MTILARSMSRPPAASSQSLSRILSRNCQLRHNGFFIKPIAQMSSDSRQFNEQLKNQVRVFYEDLWNKFDVSVADKIMSPDLVFRGTMSTATQGLAGFKQYVRDIQATFPDFYAYIDELYISNNEDGHHCIAKLRWTGTHTKPFRGVDLTGKLFEYPGIAIIKIGPDMLISKVWALGDTYEIIKVVRRE